MERSDDLYKILGVDHNASQEQIKKAYRKLSMMYHPDRNKNNPEATSKFQKIGSAYEILGDEGQRKLYDMKNLRSNMFDSKSMDDRHDIFNFLNGEVGMRRTQNMKPMYFRRSASHKPVSMMKTIELDMEKAYTGCTLPVEVTRMIAEGNIQREETETIYVQIPEGIDDNEIIMVEGKGNIIDETNKGDLKIFIRVKNNTEFIRNGLDLTFHKTISLKEALCGFSFDLKYIDGRLFKINNGNGNVISANYKKMIPSMGMKRDDHTGNLIINFSVTFPEKLTEEQVRIIGDVL
jgi:DnaJ family protein B protein 4